MYAASPPHTASVPTQPIGSHTARVSSSSSSTAAVSRSTRTNRNELITSATNILSPRTARNLPLAAVQGSFPTPVCPSTSPSTVAPSSVLPPSSHVYTHRTLSSLLSSPAHKITPVVFPTHKPTPNKELPHLSAWFSKSWSSLTSPTLPSSSPTIPPSSLLLSLKLNSGTHTKHVPSELENKPEFYEALFPPISTDDSKESNDPFSLPSLNSPPHNSNSLNSNSKSAIISQQIQLCHLAWHELIRHIHALSPSHACFASELLDRYSASLTSHMNDRITHTINDVNSYYSQLYAKNLVKIQEKLLHRREETQTSEAALQYALSELDAKSTLIRCLQIENDKDLLYSNQIVCSKEMQYLKIEREYKNKMNEYNKLKEDLLLLRDDKNSLETTLSRIEDERDQLQNSLNTMREKQEKFSKKYEDKTTQWNAEDGGRADEDMKRHTCARKIQALWRGYRIRARLLLSNRPRHLRTIHQPYIPFGFLPLMSALDCALNREHYVRLFARRNLLKWIHKLYVEKYLYDAHCLSSPDININYDLCKFIYDYYVMRHGTRDAAEMDLLDLFDSIQQFSASSIRVRLFAAFINDSFQLRKFGFERELYNITKQKSITTSSIADNEKSDGTNTDTDNSNTSTTNNNKSSSDKYADLDSSTHKQIADEKFLSTLTYRTAIHSNGGAILSSRLCHFLLKFLYYTKKLSVGPFTNVSDNNDGIMWIDVNSICELITKLFARFPTFITDACIAKIQSKANRLPNAFNSGGSNAYSSNSPASPSSHARTLTSSSSSLHTYIEWDIVSEIVIECVLDEETRYHYQLYDAFLQTHPNNIHTQFKHSNNNNTTNNHSNPNHAHIYTSRLNTLLNTNNASTENIEHGLENEMFTYMHFTSVLKNVGCDWSDDMYLRVYTLSLLRSRHRSPTIEDFVITVRCFGIASVDIEWNELNQLEKQYQKKKFMFSKQKSVNNSNTSSIDDLLIDSDDIGLTSVSTSDLRDKLREMEINCSQRVDQLSRRHEKELATLRISHERELQALVNSNTTYIDSLKKQHDLTIKQQQQEIMNLHEEKSKEVQALKQNFIKDMQMKQLLTQEHLQSSMDAMKLKLGESEQLINALQIKLQLSNDRLRKKKQELKDTQQQLDTVLGNNTASKDGASTPAADEHTTTIVKQRKIIARLSTDLDEFKLKFAHLVDRLHLNPSTSQLPASSQQTLTQVDQAIKQAKKEELVRVNSRNAYLQPNSTTSSSSSSSTPTASHATTPSPSHALHPTDASASAASSPAISSTTSPIPFTSTTSPIQRLPSSSSRSSSTSSIELASDRDSTGSLGLPTDALHRTHHSISIDEHVP